MENLKLQGSIASPDGKKAIMTTQIKIKDLLKIYNIDKTVNRDLGYHRMPKLLNYFDSIDAEEGIFLPSLVFSFREDPNLFWDSEKNILSLPQETKLIVIDGQHRIKGLERFIEEKKYANEKKK